MKTLIGAKNHVITEIMLIGIIEHKNKSTKLFALHLNVSRTKYEIHTLESPETTALSTYLRTQSSFCITPSDHAAQQW